MKLIGDIDTLSIDEKKIKTHNSTIHSPSTISDQLSSVIVINSDLTSTRFNVTMRQDKKIGLSLRGQIRQNR